MIRSLSFCTRFPSTSHTLPFLHCALSNLQPSIFIQERTAFVEQRTAFVEQRTAFVEQRTAFRSAACRESGMTRMRDKRSLATVVDKAPVDLAVTLFQRCLDVDFVYFMKEMKVGDTIEGWFAVTILHIWFSLLSLTKLPPDVYLRCRDYMLHLLWQDLDKRLKLLKAKSAESKDLKLRLYDHLQTSFLEWDEGLLSDDKVLAGALWRNVYFSRLSNPIPLNKLLKYVRYQIQRSSDLDCFDFAKAPFGRPSD